MFTRVPSRLTAVNSRAPCLGADKKARGLWERDWSRIIFSAHGRRFVSFLANGYCACVHLAWQYGESFEGIITSVQEYDPVFVHAVNNRPGEIHDRYDCQRGLKDTVEWK